jgi:hypothetical protein
MMVLTFMSLLLDLSREVKNPFVTIGNPHLISSVPVFEKSRLCKNTQEGLWKNRKIAALCKMRKLYSILSCSLYSY